MIATAFTTDALVDFVNASLDSRKRASPLPLIFGPTKPSLLSRSANRLIKTGDLERVEKDGIPYLRLTGSGKSAFHRDFPLFKFQNKKWDGGWIVISYDIPEKRRLTREYLRNKLQSLGFGLWQESVYISPHDFGEEVRDWVESNDLAGLVSVSKSKELAKDEKMLAWKVFNLENLEERYLKIIETINASPKKVVTEKIRNEYLLALSCDPLLPKELLPNDWAGLKLSTLIL